MNRYKITIIVIYRYLYNMNVSLNPHYDSLIDELASSGQYNSASEVIRSGLRLLEQQNKEQELKNSILQTRNTERIGQWRRRVLG
jgi:putative addiction module CopG family antidote